VSALFIYSGTVSITNGTLNGNTAVNDGGGIYNAGALTLKNSTITGNMAQLGADVFNAPGSTFNEKNSDICFIFPP
jgi:predicted outer membrane repeat protein